MERSEITLVISNLTRAILNHTSDFRPLSSCTVIYLFIIHVFAFECISTSSLNFCGLIRNCKADRGSVEGRAINGRLSLPKEIINLAGNIEIFFSSSAGPHFHITATCVIMGLMNFCDEYQISVLLIFPVLQVM